MPLLKRLAGLFLLLALLAVAGCSSVTLAYQQLPLIAGLWADNYLDLDSSQRTQLKSKLLAWQAWHRREELPQLQALLRQAHAALDDGVTQDELLALERGARASAERSLQHAAPLAAPLLAGLKPEQWQRLQRKMDEKTLEWREKQTGKGGPAERGKRYVNNLERGLGDLSRATRSQARADAEGWAFDLTAMSQGRATRQARTVESLRAWSRQDLGGGTALMMQNLLPQPVEQAYREQIIASMLKLLNGLSAEEREAVRQHWADWAAELRSLQTS
jgi:Family of unknown function (DUF6279)